MEKTQKHDPSKERQRDHAQLHIKAGPVFIPDQVCPSLQTDTSAVLVGIQDTATMDWNRQIQSGKTRALQTGASFFVLCKQFCSIQGLNC